VFAGNDGRLADVSRALRVLSVCSHNRTRSVLIGALLHLHLNEVGIVNDVVTAGFDAEGQPATSDALRALAARGIDLSEHVSRRVTDEHITWADLVLAAEHDHVVSISGRWPGAFERTFTLPELVAWGDHVGPRSTRTLRRWLGDIAAVRPTAFDYLETSVGEIDDPTGLSPAVWRACIDEIDGLTTRLADLLA
jgi:protein-tyrosine-phosphatase